MVENNTESLEPKAELEQQETVELQDAVVEETIAPEEVEVAVVEETVAPAKVEDVVVEETVTPAEEEVATIEETVEPVKVSAKQKKAKVVVAESADFDWDALVEERKTNSKQSTKKR